MTNVVAPVDLAPSAAEKFRTRVLPFVAMAAILVLIPALVSSRSVLTLFNAIGINIVFALSYNMLLGRAGLLSFGHAVYFGLGGYAAMHVMQAVDGGNVFWSHFPMVALPLVGFAGGLLAAAVIGWPSCKRVGIPFAMISLGIAELIASAGFMFTSIFGGEEGVSGDRTYGPLLFGFNLGPIGNVSWLIAAWTLLATVAMFAFTRTPLGKMGEAVRDNPLRVEFVGYNPHRVRYLIFMAAGGFAGLAGGMAAVTYEIFTPESLSLLPSGFVLLMAYVGGIRFFAGPILGAVALTYMQSNLSDFSASWQLYLGLIFVGIVLFAPAGLAGIVAGTWTGIRSPGAGARLVGWLTITVAALLAAAGLVIVIEVVTRITDGYGEVFDPFGQPLPPDSALTWALAAGPLIVGLGLLRLWRAGKREARR